MPPGPHRTTPNRVPVPTPRYGGARKTLPSIRLLHTRMLGRVSLFCAAEGPQGLTAGNSSVCSAQYGQWVVLSRLLSGSTDMGGPLLLAGGQGS